MFKRVILLGVLLVWAQICSAAILIENPNGKRTPTTLTMAQLNTSSDVAGTTLVITSPLSAAFSNISGVGGSIWRPDTKLVFEGAGALGNTTEFQISNAGNLQADRRYIFKGAGRVLFPAFQGSGYPDWWGAIPGAAGVEATNAAAIQRAYDEGPYTLVYPSQYKVTGVVLSALRSHRHKGMGWNTPAGAITTGLLGSGIEAVFASGAKKVADAPYTELSRPVSDGGKKFVLQNGLQGPTADVFEDISIVSSDMSNTIAFGVLGAYAAGKTNGFGYSTYNSLFKGYVGLYYQLENNASHYGSSFQGLYGGLVVNTFNTTYPTVVQKVAFHACSLNQTTGYTNGSILNLANRLGTLALNGILFENSSIESGYAGVSTYFANDITFIAPHIEQIWTDHVGGTPGLVNSSTSSSVLWESPYVETGINALLSTLGTRDEVKTRSDKYVPGGNTFELNHFATNNTLTSTAKGYSGGASNNQVAGIERAAYKTALPTATFTNVFTIDLSTATGSSYGRAMLEIEMVGVNTSATATTEFIGKRLLSLQSGTMTFSTIGTDSTVGASDIQLTDSGSGVATLAVKAAAVGTNATIRIRLNTGAADNGSTGAVVTPL